MKSLIKNTSLILSCILTGCSGGGGNDITPAAANTPVTTTKDIVVSAEEMNFQSSYKLKVDVDINTSPTERAFLSICSDFTEDNGQVSDIDYENCILRTGITNGKYEGDLKVTNDKTKLVAAIWFYDKSRSPLISTWTKETGITSLFKIR